MQEKRNKVYFMKSDWFEYRRRVIDHVRSDLAWIYTLQSKAFSTVLLVKRALRHSRAHMHEQTLF